MGVDVVARLLLSEIKLINGELREERVCVMSAC